MPAPFVAYAALAGFQMVSGLHAAETAQASARLSQYINDLNARYTEIDAHEAELQGLSQSARYKTTIDALVGQQQLGYIAQGVDIKTGTAKEIQDETELTGFLNQLDIENAARAKARGLKFQASNLRLSSFMQGLQGDISASAARTSGLIDAAKTGLTGYQYR